ncbi:MAG: GerMN domain-containing protein [Coleofasciculaceae cyanobacterium]
MQDQNNVRRVPVSVVAGISALILAGGGVGAWWAWKSSNPDPISTTSPPVPTAPQSTKPATKPVAPAAEEKVQIYWVEDVNGTIKPVANEVTLNKVEEPSETLEEAFEKLLTGPSTQNFTTTIPAGTKLRKVSVESDGVHVDLSEEFVLGGGSAAMMGRLSQVVYTATSLDPNAKVWLEVEGKPLEVLGGEGIELQQPITRQSLDEQFQE